MELIRELQRKEIEGVRLKARGLLQDSNRFVGNENLMRDIRTPKEMRESAQLLTQKSAITGDLLVRIKNGLLQSESNIKAFMSVDAALPSLLRLFSSPHVDSRLQLLAGHCLCNLALGDEHVCVRIAKTAGSYLVLRMDGLAPLLAESSVWTVGNLSTDKEAAKILRSQNAYQHVLKLYSATTDKAVKSGCIYCLIHVMYSNSEFFTNDEYQQLASLFTNISDLDSMTLFLYSLISHNPGAITVMRSQRMHVRAVHLLAEVAAKGDGDFSEMVPLIRILGNMVSEETGQVARDVLLQPSLEQIAKKLMEPDVPPLHKEATWFFANLLHHKLEEIRELSLHVVLLWKNSR